MQRSQAEKDAVSWDALWLGIRITPAADGMLALKIDDTGPGIPEHERAVVFRRF
ncbi:MAG: hypothetical protein ACJ8G3_12910 [Burkholderiaceae bacterium]